MVNDNPIYKLSKREMKTYKKNIKGYGVTTRKMLNRYHPTIYTQEFIKRWLFKLADSVGKDTRRFLVEVIDEVIIHTLTTYNDLHQGTKLNDVEILELNTKIFKEFLLSEFKGKTLDQRVSHSVVRLKGNLQRELQNIITDEKTGSKIKIDNLINSITGTDYKEGGTALRWNSRLVLSEMYRAYQFTGKAILTELGVNKVKWVNSSRHTDRGSLIDDYAKKVYKPTDIPEYPYPCNDSYFIPIYKED